MKRQRLDRHRLAARCPRRLLPPFTGRDGIQVSLKILKVILCSDFLGFYMIHISQSETPASRAARARVSLPLPYSRE
jgi:hypothetical protein